MSIPDEAFRAANERYSEVLTDLRLREGGGFKVASQNRRALLAALEAAAPHLMAQAWDEGERTGFEESFRDNDPRKTRNPYRKDHR
jgi:hypothetical protein